MKKKLLSLVLISVLAMGSMSLFSGCSKNKNEFTIWIGADSRLNSYYGGDKYNENPVVKWLEKQFDIKLNIVQPIAGKEQDNFTLAIKSKDMPDVMELSYYTGSVAELSSQGIAVDMTEYVNGGSLSNYKAYMDANPSVANEVTVDGHYYQLYRLNDSDPDQWGGWGYRKDLVLKYGKTANGWTTMDDIRFPSGETYPVSIADWDFVLPILKKGVDAGELKYCLSLPSMGYHQTGELISAWGIGPFNYVTDDGDGTYTVNSGADSDGFRAYLAKMREWYKAGYIQSDFSTNNVNHPFYALDGGTITSGKAGLFYGVLGALGDKLLYDESGNKVSGIDENIAVYPMPNPGQGTYNTTTKRFEGTGAINPIVFYKDAKLTTRSFMVTSAAKKKNFDKLLKALDYLYSDEGSFIKTFGFTPEQASQINSSILTNSNYKLTQIAIDKCNAGSIYSAADVGKTFAEIGTWYKEEVNGVEKVFFNPMADVETGDLRNAIADVKLWGTYITSLRANKTDDPVTVESYSVWNQYANTGYISAAMLNKNSAVNTQKYKSYYTDYNEYMETNTYKFITGGLNISKDENWNDYVSVLRSKGCLLARDLIQTGIYDKL